MAHHAEGDGKADGGEQQHGAERQAIPGVLHIGPEGELALDGGDCGLGRCPHRFRCVHTDAAQQAQGILIAPNAERVNCSKAVRFRRVFHADENGGACSFEGPLYACVLLCRDGRLKDLQRCRILRAEHCRSGLAPFGRVRVEQ